MSPPFDENCGSGFVCVIPKTGGEERGGSMEIILMGAACLFGGVVTALVGSEHRRSAHKLHISILKCETYESRTLIYTRLQKDSH